MYVCGGANMKSNIFKYLFIIIVIGLVGYSCYLLYGQNEEEQNDVVAEVEQTEESQIITNIRIPVVSFDTINPILSNNQNVQDISRLIYEPLLNVTSDNKIELCLASEWNKQSSTSYLIRLKENIKWQDGNTLTAKDVQFTIDRLKEEGITSIYTYNVAKVIGVDVIDDYTIRINLAEEVPFFEYNLTFPIMSSKYYTSEDFTSDDKNNHPVGTGRFKVVSNDDEKIELKINQNWWNKDNEETKLEQIYIMKYKNMGEVYNAFKIGSLDLFTTKTNQLEDYIGTIGYNKQEFYGRNLDYLSFNCSDTVIANVEVRKAISYLIDKYNIIEGLYNGGGYIANFPLTDENYLYKDLRISYELSQETATNILAEAGWSYSKKVWQRTQNYRTQKLKFDLVVNSSNEDRVLVAENIKQVLSDFGINITIKKVSDSQYQNYLDNKNYDIILTGVYTGISPDLSYYFGNGNLANFDNEEITSLLDEIKNIRDENILKEKYKRIIEIYQEQMPYVFLYYSKTTLVYSQSLYGEFNSNSYNIYDGIGTWYRQ
jgi:peptide/nickel transport system substrate-binding protein